MGKKLSDFSRLSRALCKAGETVRTDAKAPAVPVKDEGAEVLAYFSKGGVRPAVGRGVPAAVGGTPVNRTDAREAELEACRLVIHDLAVEKAEILQRLAVQEEICTRLNAEREEARAEIARLDAVCAELRAAAETVAEKETDPVPAVACAVEEDDGGKRSAEGLLEAVSVNDEMFPGEVREIIVSTLQEALDNAERSGRERRTALLRRVLARNAPSGELERRRTALRQILKDAGSFTDAQTIAALEKLGFRLISGKKHWKLAYGELRMPLSKTPSDYRSHRNSASELVNRCL